MAVPQQMQEDRPSITAHAESACQCVLIKNESRDTSVEGLLILACQPGDLGCFACLPWTGPVHSPRDSTEPPSPNTRHPGWDIPYLTLPPSPVLMELTQEFSRFLVQSSLQMLNEAGPMGLDG